MGSQAPKSYMVRNVFCCFSHGRILCCIKLHNLTFLGNSVDLGWVSVFVARFQHLKTYTTQKTRIVHHLPTTNLATSRHLFWHPIRPLRGPKCSVATFKLGKKKTTSTQNGESRNVHLSEIMVGGGLGFFGLVGTWVSVGNGSIGKWFKFLSFAFVWCWGVDLGRFGGMGLFEINTSCQRKDI